MSEMLLINPRRRARRKNPARRSAAQRAATARMLAANRARRHRNPIAAVGRVRHRRRRNPIAAVGRVHRRRRNPISTMRSRVMRRRRNPISLGGLGVNTIIGQLKDAAIGGAGAIAVDVAYGKIAPMLPASLQRTPGSVGVGDGVKAVLTVVLGRLLDKVTRGLSSKMAKGSLTVQAHGILSTMLPAGLTLGGVGFYSPAQIVQGVQRVGPLRRGVNAYVAPGTTPLLSAYMPPGRSALLSAAGGGSARERENVSQFR
jgi:hypothetical protein